jgi:hypothetical protein
VPNGITIRREVARQVDPEESVWIKFYARLAGYVILVVGVLVYSAAKLLKADTYPIWSVINTIVLVTHFPLLYLQLPGNISLFMKEFLSVLRLRDLQIERLLLWWGVTDEFDPAFIADRGHNIYFEQLGYNSRYVIRNCALILCLLAVWAVFCVTAFVFERIRSWRTRGRRIMEKPTFQINGRVKMYRSNLFHVAVQGFTRILQVAFLQVFIFVLVNFGEFSEESKLSKASKWTSIALIVVYALFFLFLVVYRLFL